jgi:hypothetical protein
MKTYSHIRVVAEKEIRIPHKRTKYEQLRFRLVIPLSWEDINFTSEVLDRIPKDYRPMAYYLECEEYS